jgi:hypothetical protein
MPDDADFDKISVGSLMDNACTPNVLDDWDFRGIRIVAPKKVALEGNPDGFGNFARVVVCGVYQLDSNYLGLREQFLDRLVLVAASVRTHHAYAGKMQPIINAVRVPSPLDGMMLTDADWAGRFITKFFNPNLVPVLGLPKQEDDYIVYAALGKYVSNVVRIAVRR